MEKFSESIKYFREKRQISQEELAKRAGITQSAISLYEKGEITPKLIVADKIANALGITIEQLMKGDDSDCSETNQNACADHG